MELYGLTARAVRDRIVAGELTAEAAARACLERIAAVEGKVHAFVSVDAEGALRRAKEVDAALARGERPGALCGIPIALKDNLCTAGTPTTCSSKILANYVPPYNATVVERVLAAGAVPIGKTNLDEFAMGSSTENSAFGTTRNPWDLERVPGGSSGGSAAAVAAGEAVMALGSDTGGSIRQPASFCGVVGLKPTYGRVSRYGLVAFASSLDQIGPIAKDVADAALLLGVIAAHDPRDSTSVPEPVPDYVGQLEADIRGRKVGLPREFFIEGMDPEVEGAVRRAVEVLAGQGAEVMEVSLPHSRIDVKDGQLSAYAVAAYYVIATAEASSNLARYDGAHYGHRTAVSHLQFAHGRDVPIEDATPLVEMFSRSRAEGFGAEVKRRILLGTYALSSGYYDAYYLKASKVRSLIRRDFDEAFERADAIACPTSPTAAFRVGERADDPLQMYMGDVFTISCNLAGIPGIAVPCGFTTGGLPIGLQLLGRPFDELGLLQLARAYERVTDHHQRRPPL
ncbi:MAG: Asp-tRNA(Asn)/Glu-tRNA(Gln) amidotransferase subunit GatA [Planctomycetes bacterium]|nr:Asp-tRNA(Asn)/Glu-tRNA(Gln) amidotransferase subunit GatA [Planctomycetota bacterium]